MFLSREAAEGTDWIIKDRPDAKNSTGSGVAHAASGKVKGWHLDVEESEERVTDGRSVAAYRLVLRKTLEEANVHVKRLYWHRGR